MTQEILVIGASGKTGRRVADRLQEHIVPVRAASRGGSTRFDRDQPATWEPAPRGADAASITYYPDRTVPAAGPAIAALSDFSDYVRATAATGVRRNS